MSPLTSLSQTAAFVGRWIVDSSLPFIRELVRQRCIALSSTARTVSSASPKRFDSGSLRSSSSCAERKNERAIDAADTELAPLRAFVLPGGTRAAAAFHAARTVCRRAERRVVALNRSEEVEAENIRYLNRLSDTFFVWARLENTRAGLGDIEWTRRGG